MRKVLMIYSSALALSGLATMAAKGAAIAKAATPAPAAPAEPAAEATNKSIINSKYRGKYKEPDWLGVQINAACAKTHEVTTKGKDGAETTRTVHDGIDAEKLFALAEENGIDPAPYAAMNAGQQRMNIGNKLRSLTLKRHGLTVGGEWVEADTDWLTEKGAPEEPTHNQDGSVIAKAKPAVEAAPAKQAAGGPAKAEAEAKAEAKKAAKKK